MKSVITYIVIGALLFISGYFYGCSRRANKSNVGHQIDTLVIVDTHIIEKPVLVDKVVKETVMVTINDTTHIRDSIYVPVIIESKTYRGDDYLAVISGYNASLDRLEIYPKTTTITQSQTVTNCNALAFGFELQYSGTTSIPIYLEYSHLLHKNIEVLMGVSYDLTTRKMGAAMGAQIQIGW